MGATAKKVVSINERANPERKIELVDKAIALATEAHEFDATVTATFTAWGKDEKLQFFDRLGGSSTSLKGMAVALEVEAARQRALAAGPKYSRTEQSTKKNLSLAERKTIGSQRAVDRVLLEQPKAVERY